MKRNAIICLLLACAGSSDCRRAATVQPTEPAVQAVQAAAPAQPQPTVCVAENVSRSALLKAAASSPTPPTPSGPAPKR